ncbi:CPXCG motif-containing cysteine-rich protein [Woeseia oceani]|uniref:CPXCG motif-containing cysteine-rich protein n=1 Tax=Woeseia oceani TaxID=1548547 RepID=A0A193LDB8_9GAMM|nr:CPXCG motif-containing cysteine-rich protein [Woeseia oceani]ANO50379.1 hypothetical protein BA177_03340 [Woeseia oceani]
MNAALIEQRIHCPFCGESMHVLIDTSAGDQSYIEDCQVCCRPMQIAFTCADDDSVDVQVSRDA